jgi:AraC-like DNA-binding protein
MVSQWSLAGLDAGEQDLRIPGHPPPKSQAGPPIHRRAFYGLTSTAKPTPMNSRKHPRYRPVQPWISNTQSLLPESFIGLRYQEFAPPPELADILVGVWTLTDPGQGDGPRQYHVVPDACSDLIFNQQAGEGFIFGTVTQAKTVEMPGPVSIVGVRLQPHLLPAFTGIPASAVQNLEPSFREASIYQMQDLFERHTALSNGTFGVREAEALARAVAATLRPDRVNIRARWLTSALLSSAGSVDQAARTTGFSARQLQRIAQHDLGLTPKRLGRILRIQQAFPTVLQRNRCHALAAVEHGFADQAHMIREFQCLTAYSPKFWRDRRLHEIRLPAKNVRNLQYASGGAV